MGFNRANIEHDSDCGLTGTAGEQTHEHPHIHTHITQAQTHAHTTTHTYSVSHCKFNFFCCLLTTDLQKTNADYLKQGKKEYVGRVPDGGGRSQTEQGEKNGGMDGARGGGNNVTRIHRKEEVG